MNDFGINLQGKHAVLRPRTKMLQDMFEKERTFVCEGGSGCIPEIGTNRKITGYWLADFLKDTISSYDLGFVIDDDGKKVVPIEVPVTGVDVAGAPQEIAQTTPKTVRRKQ